MRTGGQKIGLICGSVALCGMAACGGRRGGGGGNGTSTISGNVSNASTSAIQRSQQSWLAWLREEFAGFSGRAYAQTATPTATLVEVSADSRITLRNIRLTCDCATPQQAMETFTGFVDQTPASSNGTVLLCAAVGTGGNHLRIVSAGSATFQDRTARRSRRAVCRTTTKSRRREHEAASDRIR
jgi:hypothetical protein